MFILPLLSFLELSLSASDGGRVNEEDERAARALKPEWDDIKCLSICLALYYLFYAFVYITEFLASLCPFDLEFVYEALKLAGFVLLGLFYIALYLVKKTFRIVLGTFYDVTAALIELSEEEPEDQKRIEEKNRILNSKAIPYTSSSHSEPAKQSSTSSIISGTLSALYATSSLSTSQSSSFSTYSSLPSNSSSPSYNTPSSSRSSLTHSTSPSYSSSSTHSSSSTYISSPNYSTSPSYSSYSTYSSLPSNSSSSIHSTSPTYSKSPSYSSTTYPTITYSSSSTMNSSGSSILSSSKSDSKKAYSLTSSIAFEDPVRANKIAQDTMLATFIECLKPEPPVPPKEIQFPERPPPGKDFGRAHSIPDRIVAASAWLCASCYEGFGKQRRAFNSDVGAALNMFGLSDYIHDKGVCIGQVHFDQDENKVYVVFIGVQEQESREESQITRTPGDWTSGIGKHLNSEYYETFRLRIAPKVDDLLKKIPRLWKREFILTGHSMGAGRALLAAGLVESLKKIKAWRRNPYQNRFKYVTFGMPAWGDPTSSVTNTHAPGYDNDSLHLRCINEKDPLIAYSFHVPEWRHGRSRVKRLPSNTFITIDALIRLSKPEKMEDRIDELCEMKQAGLEKCLWDEIDKNYGRIGLIPERMRRNMLSNEACCTYLPITPMVHHSILGYFFASLVIVKKEEIELFDD